MNNLIHLEGSYDFAHYELRRNGPAAYELGPQPTLESVEKSLTCPISSRTRASGSRFASSTQRALPLISKTKLHLKIPSKTAFTVGIKVGLM